MTTSAPAAISAFAVFRNRNFSLIWTGQLISTMGTALTSLAASIYIFRLTGSALSVGLMLMATAAPSLLVGLFAGVFVDRYDRKKIMIAADISRAVLIILIPFLVSFSVVWLYVIVMLTSAIGQFFDPAHESVLPEIASDDELSAANSLLAISSFGSTAVGFAAAGLIASAADISWAFYLDGASFAFSTLCVYLIHVKHIQSEEETSAAIVIQNLRAGIRQLFDTPILRSLFTVQTFYVISIGLMNALLLPFALRALKATEFEYGLQEGLTSIGFVIGSLLMVKLMDRMREGAWLAISFIGMAVVSIIYSFLHSVPLAILVITVSGFLNAPSVIARRLIVQRNTPREMRGRVNSVFFVARDLFFVIGISAAGLADVMDVRILYLISALVLLFSGLVALVVPGLGQPSAEWKRTLSLLRGIEAAPRLGAGRIASVADIERFIRYVPQLAGMNPKERAQLAASTLVAEASVGKAVIYRGETSDSAFFVLKGKAAAGYINGDKFVLYNYLYEGDFFGEVAALTGAQRIANVVTEEDSEFLIIPSKVMKQLVQKYEALRLTLYTTLAERLNRVEMSRGGASLDQQLLRELRTSTPDLDAPRAPQ